MDPARLQPKLRREVRRLDPKLKPDEPVFGTAVLLLALLHVFPWRNRDLARATGLPLEFVAERMRRLRANGVVGRKYLHVEWDHPESGAVAFWLDVNVAEGRLARTRGGREVEYA